MSKSGENAPETLRLKGIGVSPGVVIGKARVLAPDQVHVPERSLKEDEVEHENCRLEDGLIETRKQIKAIQKDLESKTALGDASILDAHLMVLDDRSFIEEIVTEIRTDRRNAEAVVRNAAERYAAVLGSVQDDYLRERVADIRDVARRIIRISRPLFRRGNLLVFLLRTIFKSVSWVWGIVTNILGIRNTPV